ncbi:MAG TPA: hypothetical protein EYP62_07815 [Kiritimatiellae bacterium]|nr:hypothetical protein [Kiritimatiellia bacterium]
MPGGDRTGPVGTGPMTGRGAGYCAGYGVPGYANPWPGRGVRAWSRGAWGWGRGFGRGWRNWYYATGLTGWQRAALVRPPAWPVPVQGSEQEKEALRQEAGYLERELAEVRRRLEELEASGKSE